jgi:hypothetical protein
MLADDLALALDPVRLARRVGLKPDPWQADVLRFPAVRVLLNCSRQSGNSSISAVLALHIALYAAGSLTLLLSPSLRQPLELFRKLIALLEQLARRCGADGGREQPVPRAGQRLAGGGPLTRRPAD